MTFGEAETEDSNGQGVGVGEGYVNGDCGQVTHWRDSKGVCTLRILRIRNDAPGTSQRLDY